MNELNQVLDFFREIGISYQLEPLPASGFLPGVLIKNGALLIDPEQLSYPGDLLHEAGHIAVVPSAKRHLLNDNVNESANQGPAEEMAAIAWSWAALQHLKLPPQFLFHPAGYKGGSDSYIEAFTTGGGFGHPMLSWYGMCHPAGTEAGYPQMQLWLRP
ncbi:hypothetical protein EIK76_17310 [Rheinheimera mesophila]|uniref:ImmA/IrrE family metallo-endopeptidase n=1 Tax=Rheinheimera mesophila TaxID=1547515 RepID=A0A3P3QBE4_9GAMM|nr:hypothetical protein [Rheinheimera mesophila]RRJ18408.1 hypothetical protein EIK76_17310 [Rheinheimera mesophila]